MARTIVYTNKELIQDIQKNGCGSGWIGSTVTYRVPAGKYISTVSQAAADNQALAEVNSKGQAYANEKGVCSPAIWFNEEISTYFEKNDCEFDIKGSKVKYTVKKGKYVSYVSQDDANSLALDEINANGQEYANKNGTCCNVYISRKYVGNFCKNDCPEGECCQDPIEYVLDRGAILSVYSQG